MQDIGHASNSWPRGPLCPAHKWGEDGGEGTQRPSNLGPRGPGANVLWAQQPWAQGGGWRGEWGPGPNHRFKDVSSSRKKNAVRCDCSTVVIALVAERTMAIRCDCLGCEACERDDDGGCGHNKARQAWYSRLQCGGRLCCHWCKGYWEQNPHPSYVPPRRSVLDNGPPGIPLPNAYSRRGGKGSASSVGKGSASSASSVGPDLEAKVEALQEKMEELEESVKKVEELELSVKKLESMMENFIELTKVQASPMLEDGGDS